MQERKTVFVRNLGGGNSTVLATNGDADSLGLLHICYYQIVVMIGQSKYIKGFKLKEKMVCFI